ncbi:MAG: hypothetical protein ABI740_02160 [Alphaproteobacteria bacterium]
MTTTTIRTITTAITIATLFTLAGCDDKAATTTTPAPAPVAAAMPAPAPAAIPAPDAAPTAGDLERAKLAAMKNVFADEAAWNKACVDDKVDAKICECAGKATVKTVGAKGLYGWVWQGYINRDATARMRSNGWFTENKIDKAGQQKFADAVGKCYTL